MLLHKTVVHSASHDVPLTLCNPKAIHNVHRSPAVVCTQGQTNGLATPSPVSVTSKWYLPFKFYFCKIFLILFAQPGPRLPRGLFPWDFSSQHFVRVSHFPRAWYIPVFDVLLDSPLAILWHKAKIINLLIIVHKTSVTYFSAKKWRPLFYGHNTR